MAKTPKPNFIATLQTLVRHNVDFIIVGGVAAAIQGATISTFDLDLVHSRNPENITRLLEALDELEAHYRIPGAESLKPTRSHLESEGHQLLMTRFGQLDLLGIIGSGTGYAELLPDSIEENVAGIKLRILKLAAVIRTKEQTGHDKDKATLALLRRTLEERNKSRK